MKAKRACNARVNEGIVNESTSHSKQHRPQGCKGIVNNDMQKIKVAIYANNTFHFRLLNHMNFKVKRVYLLAILYWTISTNLSSIHTIDTLKGFIMICIGWCSLHLLS